MPQFIQFIHPAPQPRYGRRNSGIIPWNLTLNPHKRKFISNNGHYITTTNQINSGNITFWGEWEPESNFTKIPVTTRHSPIAINTIPGTTLTLPFLGTPHSTDPYVFDNSFYYTNCKQTKFCNILKSLPPKSIIVFGSKINGCFCLDTLMVIQGSSFQFTPTTFSRTNLPFSISNKFIDSVITPLTRVSPNQQFCFYSGATYNNPLIINNTPIYSFVPYTTGRRPFDRPIINSKYINHCLAMGIKSSILSNRQILNEWQNIVDQVQRNNLNLGVLIN